MEGEKAGVAILQIMLESLPCGTIAFPSDICPI